MRAAAAAQQDLPLEPGCAADVGRRRVGGLGAVGAAGLGALPASGVPAGRSVRAPRRRAGAGPERADPEVKCLLGLKPTLGVHRLSLPRSFQS